MLKILPRSKIQVDVLSVLNIMIASDSPVLYELAGEAFIVELGDMMIQVGKLIECQQLLPSLLIVRNP